MKKFIRGYVNPNTSRINHKLINKDYDDDLISYVVSCCRALEVHQGIKFIGYNYIDDESKIDLSTYINTRSRKTKKTINEKHRSIKDGRFAEIHLQFEITGKSDKRINPDDEISTEIINKKLLVPVPDDRGIYIIRGTEYFLMYQVTEKSTYTTKDALVTKSFIGVKMVRKFTHITDTKGNTYDSTIYSIDMFKKKTNVMSLMIAKKGLSESMRFMNIHKLIKFRESPIEDEGMLNFIVSKKLYISVPEYWFSKYSYIRSIVGMLLEPLTNRATIDSILDNRFWVESLATSTQTKDKKYERGLGMLVSFDRLIDDTTKKILKLHPYNKSDIYTIIRWMMTNFNELIKKNNIDLENKRLRCNEYMAALLMQAFSDKLNRLMTIGAKANIKNIRDLFSFPGNIIFQQLQKSNLLRYEGRVNDMDFFNKLKVTMKGPNSVGKNSDNSVPMELKDIDPSFIGRFDINVCGKSDPGLSAMLTPFCETDGLYFSDKNEPEDFLYTLNSDKPVMDNDALYIDIPVGDTMREYYDMEYITDELYRDMPHDDFVNSDIFISDDVEIGDDVIDE